MDIPDAIAKELSIEKWQAQAAIELIDEGNTIAFITRYRKEKTGSLDDEQLRDLSERLIELRNLEERKVEVIANIKKQKRLTPKLKEMIMGASNLMLVEDLYRPYKPKMKTKGIIAIEKGLEGLADKIIQQTIKISIKKEALSYVCKARGVPSVEAAITGAEDIIAEKISDNSEYWTKIRELTIEKGQIISTAIDSEVQSDYEQYYDFKSPISQLPGYRTLAINRGEKENYLTVQIEAPISEILDYLESKIIINPNSNTNDILKESIKDSYTRIIAPAVEQEVRHSLTEIAQSRSIKIFGYNLFQLLMQPPVAGHVVCGWDPAFRTGCKLAVVDRTGKVLHTDVIYPTHPQRNVEEEKLKMKRLIRKYRVTLISVGNGTACRESEVVISQIIKEMKSTTLKYVIVDEAGASIYSASKTASEEFPDYDVYQRGAISIARRIQDPLAELVKIDPKCIGVGQYQHDMNQDKLSHVLDAVVERCVNLVGVDLNTASAKLMQNISGINKKLAKNIVKFREKNGPFRNRKELLKVPSIGPKEFQQCAGFMRIKGGDDPLDSTSVHPESYAVARKLIKKLGLEINGEITEGSLEGISNMITDINEIAKELHIGVPTLIDIIKELEKPARDPREKMPKPILRQDVLELNDLQKDMILSGTVRNITDFGAFVDIGVHQDGLVHISEMSPKFVKTPLDIVKVGDIIKVKVLGVDLCKKRINLTMKNI